MANKYKWKGKERIHRIKAGARNAGFNTVVHHKDGNKANNARSNLRVMSRSAHTTIEKTKHKTHPRTQRKIRRTQRKIKSVWDLL